MAAFHSAIITFPAQRYPCELCVPGFVECFLKLLERPWTLTTELFTRVSLPDQACIYTPASQPGQNQGCEQLAIAPGALAAVCKETKPAPGLAERPLVQRKAALSVVIPAL